MYLLGCLCILLIIILYIQTHQETFINMNTAVDVIKRPHKHINRLRRKLRKTKENIHKQHIYPLKVKFKKFLS